MAINSYNETKANEAALHHMFLPGGYGLVCEAIIGALALVLFNLSSLSGQLLAKDAGTINPVTLWPHFIRHLLGRFDNDYIVQQAVLFSLWAIAGALAYVLVFRLVQAGLGVRRSIGLGVRYVRQDHDQGFMRWLGSLHDFFVKALLVLAGAAALLIGSLVCFGTASQELNNALAGTFPANSGQLLLSLAAAFLSVRLVAFGLTLLSRRFRNWYLY